jgi:hypothetical protein
MLDRIKGLISKDPIVSLNVIPFLILFTIPFPPAVLFWPYPLILSLDPFLSSKLNPLIPEWANLLALPVFLLPFWLFGLGLAFLVGKYFSDENIQRKRPWYVYWWTPLVWFGMLILIQAVVFLFVKNVLGIPVGE